MIVTDCPSLPPSLPPSPSSFFQSLCILGYCVFPLDIAALANLLVGLAFKSVIVKTLIVAVGFAWATRGKQGREGGREGGRGDFFPLDIAALANLLVGLAFKSVIVKTLIYSGSWVRREGREGREGGRAGV